jgi:competence protein ComGF
VSVFNGEGKPVIKRYLNVFLAKEVRRENGFTLLDTLFSFSIFLFILFLIPGLLHTSQLDTIETPYEIEVFFEQANRDVRMAKESFTNDSKLTLLTANNETISYDLYYSVLRRQVNGTGYEVMLQTIQSVEFSKVLNGVNIQILDIKNLSYTRRLSHAPLKWEEGI